MGDNVDGEYIQQINVLELGDVEPIVRNLYSLKQQEAKVTHEYFSIVLLYIIYNYINVLILDK